MFSNSTDSIKVPKGCLTPQKVENQSFQRIFLEIKLKDQNPEMESFDCDDLGNYSLNKICN